MRIKPRAIAAALCMIFFIGFAVCGVVRSTDKDTSLNRIDHPSFPDTVYDVIHQPNQFSVMWNSRLERCYVMPEIVELVKEELLERTNYDCVFFMAGGYSKYGEPLFQECCHYFSSYD